MLSGHMWCCWATYDVRCCGGGGPLILRADPKRRFLGMLLSDTTNTQGVIAVEGLVLTAVDAGLYQLHCLPLSVVGSDGAPARCILMR